MCSSTLIQTTKREQAVGLCNTCSWNTKASVSQRVKESDQAAIARIEQWIKSIDTNQATLNAYPVVPTVALAGGSGVLEPSGLSSKPTLLQTPVEEANATGASALSRKEMLLNLRNNIGEEDPNAKLSKPAKSVICQPSLMHRNWQG